MEKISRTKIEYSSDECSSSSDEENESVVSDGEEDAVVVEKAKPTQEKRPIGRPKLPEEKKKPKPKKGPVGRPKKNKVVEDEEPPSPKASHGVDDRLDRIERMLSEAYAKPKPKPKPKAKAKPKPKVAQPSSRFATRRVEYYDEPPSPKPKQRRSKVVYDDGLIFV